MQQIMNDELEQDLENFDGTDSIDLKEDISMDISESPNNEVSQCYKLTNEVKTEEIMKSAGSTDHERRTPRTDSKKV